ncbi:hypothetical protein B0H13DRAFT_1929097 [Mycena leptocephala]|nr:hypothetical protein B0H13DRAFT_1929097 [Mycena leptocephala]
MLTWAVRIHPQRLLVPAPDAVSPTHPPPPALAIASANLSSSSACALIPAPRAHDDHKPAYSLWASRHYAAVVRPFALQAIPARTLSVRILASLSGAHSPYLRSDLRRTNNVNRYPPQLSILFSGSLESGLDEQIFAVQEPQSRCQVPTPTPKCHGPRRSIGLSKIHNRDAMFLAVNNSISRCYARKNSKDIEAGGFVLGDDRRGERVASPIYARRLILCLASSPIHRAWHDFHSRYGNLDPGLHLVEVRSGPVDEIFLLSLLPTCFFADLVSYRLNNVAELCTSRSLAQGRDDTLFWIEGNDKMIIFRCTLK